MTPGAKIAVFLFIVVAGLGTVGVLSFMNRPEATNGALVQAVENRTHPVRTLSLVPRDLRERLVSTGILKAEQDVVLTSEVGGKVRSITKSLGDRCKKGELFTRIDPESYALALAEAKAAMVQSEVALGNAELEWARMQKLEASKVATGQQLDNARAAVSTGEAQVARAQAAVELARRNTRETNVTCPFTGYIAERMVDKGQAVAPLEPLARLVDTSRLKMLLSVTSDRLSRIELGARAVLSDPALPGREYQGVVSRMGVAADPLTRTFPVEVEVHDENSRLHAGQIVQVTLPLQEHEGVLAVPVEAILKDGGKPRVVLAKQGKAEIRDVRCGREIDGFVIVEEGLEQGDELVVQGGAHLSTGDELEVTGRLREPSDKAAPALLVAEDAPKDAHAKPAEGAGKKPAKGIEKPLKVAP